MNQRKLWQANYEEARVKVTNNQLKKLEYAPKQKNLEQH